MRDGIKDLRLRLQDSDGHKRQVTDSVGVNSQGNGRTEQRTDQAHKSQKDKPTAGKLDWKSNVI